MCVCLSACVCVLYTAVVVDVDMVQPAQVLVRLQEAGQLLVLSGRLGQQLPPLPLLHVPAEQEVGKVLQQEVTEEVSELLRETLRHVHCRNPNTYLFCEIKLDEN